MPTWCPCPAAQDQHAQRAGRGEKCCDRRCCPAARSWLRRKVLATGWRRKVLRRHGAQSVRIACSCLAPNVVVSCRAANVVVLRVSARHVTRQCVTCPSAKGGASAPLRAPCCAPCRHNTFLRRGGRGFSPWRRATPGIATLFFARVAWPFSLAAGSAWDRNPLLRGAGSHRQERKRFNGKDTSGISSPARQGNSHG